MKLFHCVFYTLPFWLLAGPLPTSAQSARQVAATARVHGRAETAATVALKGHVPEWANAATDAGPINPSLQLNKLHLTLSRSAAVEAAFDQLLADQQNPASPRYHQWLTPEQNAEQYGIAPGDLQAVTDWLAAMGLHVDNIAAGGLFITFSGPAITVERAFATSLHNFSHAGTQRFAPVVEPSVPAALSSVILSIDGLSEQMAHLQSSVRALPGGDSVQRKDYGSPQPNFTRGGGAHYLAPGDFNTIYDINPVHSAGYTGSGYHVANLIDSRIATSDIDGFNSIFGLSVAQPNQIVLPGQADPGVKFASEGEADLDVQRILGTAPGVTVDLLVMNSLSFSNIFSALQYEIGTLNDPIVSMSFGACNSGSTSTSSQFDSYFKTGAAQGISFFVSSGDNAAADCDAGSDSIPATQVLSTNLICASSYVTCVGGTQFAEGSGSYWGSTNDTTQTSATGYIPEGVWNEPTTGSGSNMKYQAAGGGGGVTKFPKPSWQTGLGVPSDGVRDVPDLSFSASLHDGYLVCQGDVGNVCSAGQFLSIVYGTSASAPGMAGIAALFDQRMGARQGNVNPLLYSLAAKTTNVFHDATPATSGVIDCSTATPSICNNSTPSANALTGGLAGYTLTPGYDLATGLGSLDVANFLSTAADSTAATVADATVSLTASAAPITTSQTVTFTATIVASTSSTPTGTVQFYANGARLGSAIAITAGKATTSAQSFSAEGTYSITAVYSGDSALSSASSTALSLVVASPTTSFALSPAARTLTLASGSTTGGTNAIRVAASSSFAGTVALACSLTTSAAAYQPTCSIAPGSVTVAANGTVSALVTLSTTSPHTSSLPAPGATSGIALAAFLALMPFRRRRNLRPLLALLLLTAGLSTLTGCGKGGTLGMTSSTTTPPGSAGTYTVTVTGTSNNATASTSFTLVVD